MFSGLTHYQFKSVKIQMKLVSDIDMIQSCLESKQARNEVLMEIIFKKYLLGSSWVQSLE